MRAWPKCLKPLAHFPILPFLFPFYKITLSRDRLHAWSTLPLTTSPQLLLWFGYCLSSLPPLPRPPITGDGRYHPFPWHPSNPNSTSSPLGWPMVRVGWADRQGVARLCLCATGHHKDFSFYNQLHVASHMTMPNGITTWAQPDLLVNRPCRLESGSGPWLVLVQAQDIVLTWAWSVYPDLIRHDVWSV
jgi:hypothetical protein